VYLRLCGSWPVQYTSLGCDVNSAACSYTQGNQKAISYGSTKPFVELTKISGGLQFNYSAGDVCKTEKHWATLVRATCQTGISTIITDLHVDYTACSVRISVSGPQACGMTQVLADANSGQDLTADKKSSKTLVVLIAVGSAVLALLSACIGACCVYRCSQRKRCTKGAYVALNDMPSQKDVPQAVQCVQPPPFAHSEVQPPTFAGSYVAPSPAHSVVPLEDQPQAPALQPMQYPQLYTPGTIPQPGMVYLVPYFPPQQRAAQQ